MLFSFTRETWNELDLSKLVNILLRILSLSKYVFFLEVTKKLNQITVLLFLNLPLESEKTESIFNNNY